MKHAGNRWCAAMVALCVLSLAACSTVSVKTRYDHATDFSSLRTYSWLADQPGVKGEESLDYASIEKHVRGVVDRHLQGQGYKPVARDADFHVVFQARLKEKTDKTLLTRPDEESYEPGAGITLSAKDEKGWKVREAEPEYEIRNYERGRLRLRFEDAATGDVLWRGRVKVEVDRDISEDDRTLQFEKAMGRVLSRFPPKGMQVP